MLDFLIRFTKNVQAALLSRRMWMQNRLNGLAAAAAAAAPECAEGSHDADEEGASPFELLRDASGAAAPADCVKRFSEDELLMVFNLAQGASVCADTGGLLVHDTLEPMSLFSPLVEDAF